MNNPQDIKKAILDTLAEKGDYQTILNTLSGEERERGRSEKSDKVIKLLEPFSAFADLLTQNTEGVFIERLVNRLDDTTRKALTELVDSVEENKRDLQSELRALLSDAKEGLVSEHLARYESAERALESKLMELAVEVVTAQANEMLPELKEGARLTNEEIDVIIDTAALSVESQIALVIGDYIKDQGVRPEQILGFKEAVEAVLPPTRQITWGEIVGKPEISQGGTNVNLVRQMIDNALSAFSGGATALDDLTDVDATTPAANQVLTWNDATSTWEAADAPGSSGGEANTAANLGTGEGVYGTKVGVELRFKSLKAGTNVTMTSDANEVTLNATQPDVSTFETTTQLNTRDTNNRNTDNHTDGTTNKVFTATEKTKLTGIAESANNYAHPNHSGDVTSVADGATTIANGAVTLAKQANMATASLVYRKTAGDGAPEVNSLATLKTDLGLVGNNTGDQTTIVGITGTTAQFNTALSDGSFATGGGTATGTNTGDNATNTQYSSLVSNATHTGDVTGATELTIANSAVTLAKQANVDTATVFYRKTAGAGAPEVQTLATLKTDLGLTGTNSGDQTRDSLGLDTDDSPQFAGIELGHATENTLTASSGVLSIEGVVIPSISSTNTLTNKRITKRTSTEASSATPTINVDNVDEHFVTALEVAITSMTTNLSGTPTTGQGLFISITGTAARAITWGASFSNGPVALPTTTVTTTALSVFFRYDGTVWRCMASGSTV